VVRRFLMQKAQSGLGEPLARDADPGLILAEHYKALGPYLEGKIRGPIVDRIQIRRLAKKPGIRLCRWALDRLSSSIWWRAAGRHFIPIDPQTATSEQSAAFRDAVQEELSGGDRGF
jgi:hypothetical protein